MPPCRSHTRYEDHISSSMYLIFCLRCGYSKERYLDHDKYESLKNDPEHKDDDFEKLRRQSIEYEVIFPSGSYLYQNNDMKGMKNARYFSAVASNELSTYLSQSHMIGVKFCTSASVPNRIRSGQSNNFVKPLALMK